MNFYQVSKIKLSPKVIDCIVFWTKDPTNMLSKLDMLEHFNYYFQFTITSYDKTIERFVQKKSKIIDSFIELSDRIGKERVIWRYDPIFLTETFDKDYHYKYFDYLASQLKDHTCKCVISFLDLYRKTNRNLRSIKVSPFNEKEMREVAGNLVEIAKNHNLSIETCSEIIDLSDIGINHGKCIDDRLISEIIGTDILIDKDKNQRESCGCVSSIDIGAYNTCGHKCLYCYANFSENTVNKNTALHNVNSPLLLGELGPSDKVNDREMKSFVNKQMTLKL